MKAVTGAPEVTVRFSGWCAVERDGREDYSSRESLYIADEESERKIQKARESLAFMEHRGVSETTVEEVVPQGTVTLRIRFCSGVAWA